ncbi:MAG TPA: LacI family DNA-binding transcriptional regulator [Propionicimonas sp.]
MPAEPPSGRPRLKDVARLAGVSAGTVSHTLNHPDRVTGETRELVLEAIRQLGFVPNAHARALKSGANQVIGLVVLDIASPFFMQVARAVERCAREMGHVVILSSSDDDSERESALLRILAAQRVRGCLLTPAGAAPSPAWFSRNRLPVVLLDHPGGSQDCSVAVDHVAGARLAVRHLLELGHRRVAFVGGPVGLRQMADRAQGARHAIIDAGQDPVRVLVEVMEPAFGIADGIDAAEQLLAGGLPSAVFCGNDMLAFGVYRRLRQEGLRVPEDVALVGYDDVDFAADWVVPLTSVRQPTDQLGYLAAQLLFEHVSGHPDHRHQQVMLHPELVVRRSSGSHIPHTDGGLHHPGAGRG